MARSGLRLGFPTVLGGETWWEEDRPAEGGRRTVVHRAADGALTDLLPAPWDARTRVHEYGGRSYVVVPGHGVVFAHHADQRLYLARVSGSRAERPRPITPEPKEPAALRYADLRVHGGPDGPRLWCVRERHHQDAEVTRSIVSVALTGDHEITEWVTGSDFYASPTPSPDGRHLAYVCWSHPHMPWTSTELRVTRLSDGATRLVMGGRDESVLAPVWCDDRRLYVVSDRSGWWNLYRADVSTAACEALCPAEEEFAGPLWQLGGLPYAVLDGGRLAVLHGHGDLRLGILDPDTGTLRDLDVPFRGWSPVLDADGGTLAGIGYGPDRPRTVVRIDTATGRAEEVRREIEDLPAAAVLPVPCAVEFKTVEFKTAEFETAEFEAVEFEAAEPRAVDFDGGAGGRVHAYLYPPRQADEGGAPYVVFVHGGPTSHATSELSLEKAFFTSRGIGVIDVNYGGSTGYGRAYRERLRGRWGVTDVEDVIAAAKWLIAEGLADPARIAVRGASAGGWTVMAACGASDVFAGGVSVAGVSALAPLVAATHDFESRYVEWLVGPEDRYGEREPLARADRVNCPMLLMQGLADPVVPPSQSRAFADRLMARGVLCTYLTFEGEAHGFRRLETRAAALAAELSFYLQIFR
ncbi:dipeptidyl aminopeptidase [Microbispora rosea subsp. aerata]|nr:prolyl oligopeptidase family serine peptidase [Microbispora rosea]GGO07182.1 dipeptidyl aminopeptidase [Microbispora rosea subsp. aerata]GIH53137.1 dipeptidyl aminopeptidase [Microbispora rosea subsp. aerata]GLJ83951.1 dipeptidyl aminopeptidase [Microbispora rosea subsp. aerata]